MNIDYITSTEHEEWNKFVAQESAFGLLQSWEWGEFKERLGWQAIRIGIKDHNRLVAGTQLLIKLLPLQR